MKILLVRLPQIKKSIFHIIPPLGLGYLASALRKFKIDIEILDCIQKDLTNEDLIKKIKSLNPNFIGFSVYTHDLNNIKILSSYIKNCISRKILIIIGGPHPSAAPEHTLNYLKYVDFAFKGEAEIGLPLLLEYLLKYDKCGFPINNINLEHIPGLIYRVKNGVHVNNQLFFDDLDQLGFPDWKLINPPDYFKTCHGVFFKSNFFAPIFATRGCPQNCYFCSAHKIMGKKIRRHSVEHIITEISFLMNNYGIREFHFLDDNFTADRNFLISFCKELLNRKIDIFWSCPNGVRIDSLDEEMLSFMRKTGCYSISVGLESGVQSILDKMNKGLNLIEIKNKIKLIKEMKFLITGFFVFGYPGETANDMSETIKFARSLPLDVADFSNFLPLPGSYITERLGSEVQWSQICFDRFSSPANIISITANKVEESFRRKIVRRAYLSFYMRPKIIFRLLARIKNRYQIYFIGKRILEYIF